MLEARRGDRVVAITVRFGAIQELRDRVTAQSETASGLLFGRCLADAITIDSCTAGEQPRAPVGAFRTQPGGWPEVTESDCQTIQTAIAESAPEAVFLIVRALRHRPWVASLFTLDTSQPSPTYHPLLEFPFDEYLLRNGWLTDLPPLAAPQPRVVAGPPWRRRAPWLAGAAAAALIGGGAAAYRLLASGAPVVDEQMARGTGLHLRVARNVEDLDITWNRHAEALRDAKSGALTIRNGRVDRTIPVSSKQLREGRVTYHPVSGVDADFRLEIVTADGNLVAESTQLLGFDTAPSSPLPIPATAKSKEAHQRTERPRPQRQAADRAEATRKVQPTAVEGATRTEAVVVRRANPVLTRDVLAEMQKAEGKVSISVLVSITPQGTVQSAKVVGSTGEPSQSGSYMRLASLKAAREWKFRPAMVGGKPSASELTLVFNF